MPVPTSTHKGKTARARAVLSLLLVLVALSACTQQPAQPPTAAGNLPVYPGSSKPNVVDKSAAQDGTALLITYSSTAAPSTIISYYDDLLLSDNWVSMDVPDRATTRRYTWRSDNYDVAFSIDLDTLVKSGQTDVTLSYREVPRLRPAGSPTP